MKAGQLTLWVLALVAMLAVARFLAPVLHLPPGAAMIGLMVILYLIASFIVSRLQRRQEERGFSQLAAEGLDPALVDELRATRARNRAEAKKAVRIGLVWVNLPILPIMLGPLSLARYAFDIENDWVLGATLVLGFVAAWVWWSVNISLWKRWVVRRGVDATELQEQAVESSLVWPRGHLLERTELDSVLSRWSSSRTVASNRADKRSK